MQSTSWNFDHGNMSETLTARWRSIHLVYSTCPEIWSRIFAKVPFAFSVLVLRTHGTTFDRLLAFDEAICYTHRFIISILVDNTWEVVIGTQLQPMKIDGRMNRIFLSMIYHHFSNTGATYFTQTMGRYLNMIYPSYDTSDKVHHVAYRNFLTYLTLISLYQAIWRHLFQSLVMIDVVSPSKTWDSCMNLYQAWNF